MHMGDVLQAYRGAIVIDSNWDAIEVLNRLYIAQTPYHVLGLRHLYQPPTDVLVGFLDGHFYSV